MQQCKSFFQVLKKKEKQMIVKTIIASQVICEMTIGKRLNGFIMQFRYYFCRNTVISKNPLKSFCKNQPSIKNWLFPFSVGVYINFVLCSQIALAAIG